MARIIGKLFWLSIFVTCFAQAEIIMRLIDEEGAQLESVGAGRPFLITVELKNLSNGLREPVIENLDSVEHYRSGVQMSTVNGKTTAVYTYKCRIDTLGTYAIGPAIIPETQEKSQQIKIEVLDEPKYVRSAKKEDSSILFRIFADPESAVVGQKVKIRIRFYTTDPRMRLQNMTVPQLSAFKLIDKIGPAFGKETINGRAYEYTEWIIELFAQHAGNHLIPAFYADYEYPSASRFSMFSWGHFAQTKRMYSNSIRMNVEPLPKGTHIDFVGSKATARASVSQANAKIGEGIIYTITFYGDGDIESVGAPKIVGVPDWVKFYESKSSEAPASGDQLPSKQFEYVIQGIDQGSWEIPAQHFNVYDVDDRTVKTVSTAPVSIIIIGDDSNSKKIDQSQPVRPACPEDARRELAKDKNELSNELQSQDDCPIKPIYANDPWYPTPERGPINWSLFFMLVFAPCAYGIFGALRARLTSKMDSKKRIKRAASLAVASLERAKKVKDYEAPYHIFITFLADIFEVKQAQISGEWIKNKLIESKSSEAGIAEWDRFFASLVACAFGGAVEANIFDVTAKWITNWKTVSLKTSGRPVLFFILFFTWMNLAYALNGQETFLQANQAYTQKEYQNALNLYSKIEKKGSAVWYNMGNCHYQLGHEADAIACWKRSQKGGSAEMCKDSAYNIDFVLNGSEQRKESFVQRLQRIWHSGSTLIVQLIFLLVWALLCMVIYLSKRGKKYKVATFVFGTLIIPVTLNLGYRFMHQKDGCAIVYTESQLYAGPNEHYHVIGSVQSKDQLVVYCKHDDWYKVKNGAQVGWINARSVVVI